MTGRERVANGVLWAAVLVWACMLGGIVYETLVVIPAWMAALPESLIVMTHSDYGVVPGRMWLPFSNVLTLMAIAALIAAWRDRPTRKWLSLALLLVVLSHVMQFAYFWPTIRTMAAPGIAAEQLRELAEQWRLVNWFRVAYVTVGFVATLCAFRRQEMTREI